MLFPHKEASECAQLCSQYFHVGTNHLTELVTEWRNEQPIRIGLRVAYRHSRECPTYEKTTTRPTCLRFQRFSIHRTVYTR